MPNQTRQTRALIALPLVLSLACFPGGVTDATKTAGAISAAASPTPTAPVATVASPTPSVLVRNSGGHPVQGVPVTFSVTTGGGSVTGATVETNKDGIAAVGSWTYGNLVGQNQLSAKVGSLNPVLFDVSTTAGAPAQAVKVNDGQAAEIGQALPQPVAVVVKDSYGNAVAGASVSFSASSGAVSPASEQTDANGSAQATWTMPTTPGAAALSAVVANLPAVAFAATAKAAAPASVTKTNDGQSGTVGSVLANPVLVTVKDSYGNPVSGVTVQFAASGNGSANPATAMTDASGQASSQWTLPTTAGSVSLSATAGSLPAVSFNATARAGAPATLVAGSYPTTDTVYTSVGDSVSVSVADSYGNAISGASVAFSGSGTVSPASTTTSASGIARAKWILPKTAGAASLVASIGNLSATFNVTAVAGPPASMLTSGANQSGTVGTVLANPIQVTVKDAYGNLVGGAAVTFGPSGNGKASPTSVSTNTAGQASTQWTLPTTAGSTLMSVSAGNVSATVGATANPDVPASITKANLAGDNQTGSAGSTLPEALTVVVRDQYGNAVVGTNVSFTPDGGSVSPTSMPTSTSGQASTSWTLPSTAGTWSVTVNAGNAPAVVFHATSTVVNNDPCAAKGTLTVGATVTGDMSTSQCAFGTSKKIDLWSLNLNGSTPLDIRLVADNNMTLDTWMTMYRGQYSGQTDVIAENDDNNYYDGTTNSGIHLLGGTGQFLVGATYFSPSGGPYHLSAQSWNGLIDRCQYVYAVSGTNTNQTLDNTDCARGATSSRWADWVQVYLHAGETMTVGMSSTQFDTQLEVDQNVNGTWTAVAIDDNGGGGTNSRLAFTAPATDMYWVYATAAHDNSGGAYNLTIDVASSAPAPTAARTTSTTTMTRTISGTRTVSRTALPRSGTAARQTIDSFNSGVKTTTIRQQ